LIREDILAKEQASESGESSDEDSKAKKRRRSSDRGLFAKKGNKETIAEEEQRLK
jgi:hypothetical protein